MLSKVFSFPAIASSSGRLYWTQDNHNYRLVHCRSSRTRLYTLVFTYVRTQTNKQTITHMNTHTYTQEPTHKKINTHIQTFTVSDTGHLTIL